MSRWRKTWLLGLAGILAAGFCATRVVDAERAVADPAELQLYPSGRMLDLVALGQPTFLADTAWLQAIQYYGKHHRPGDHRYPLAEHLFRVIQRADPRFRTAALFGGLVLGDDVGDMDAARRVFRRARCVQPRDWRLAFHHGFLEYLHGDPRLGAFRMEEAANLPGAPPYVARLAAHAYDRAGRSAAALAVWERIARETDDPGIRALAERRAAEIRGSRGAPPRREGS
ncbi:MAG: hypothetical protein GF346_07665 [Candidatus Eisenbacteria bacterium]|nr:hypothetical protein [Candidatus Latescibacterota bacterium]MBD3302309.1 hypothetical protein [Candidatus Eisenbacteria bacterium]